MYEDESYSSITLKGNHNIQNMKSVLFPFAYLQYVSDVRLCDVVCFTVGWLRYHKMVDDVLGSSENIKQKSLALWQLKYGFLDFLLFYF